MTGFDISFLKEVGGIFRFGSGVLGKSAIALGIVLSIIFAAVLRLHSDKAIIGMVSGSAFVFFVWFFGVLRFADKHPDAALLEGAEWSGYQRFQAGAKGYLPPASEQQPELAPGAPPLPPTDQVPKQPDKESGA